jgi:hypothetical protein
MHNRMNGREEMVFMTHQGEKRPSYLKSLLAPHSKAVE